MRLIGSIKVGKRADRESPEELLETRVLATMVDGVIRHRDGI